MKNIKIGPKLILSFLFTAVLAAFMGIYLINSMKVMEEHADTLYEKGAIPLGLLVRTAYDLQEIRLSLWKWQRTETDSARAEILKEIEKAHSDAVELIEQQKNLVLVEAGKKVLDNLISASDKFLKETQNYIKTAKFNPVTNSPEKLFPSVPKAAAEMKAALETAIEMRTNSTKKLSDDASQIAKKSEAAAAMILVIVLIISISLSILLTLSTTKPLHTVVEALSKIEKGDMTVRIDMKRKDEFGILTNALNNLSAKLQDIFGNFRLNADTIAGSSEELSAISRQLTSNAEDVASKSHLIASDMEAVSANINTIASSAEEASVNSNDVSSAVEQVANNIHSMASISEESSAKVSEVAKSVKQVADNINAMASSAEETSVNANEVAGAAEEMSTNMDTIASAMEEMSASIKEISNNANDARSVANNASVKSSEATDVMNKLGVAAKEIGQVIDVIKKIADKTNLLA